MPTVRPFCYNPSPNEPVPGTDQVGSIAAEIDGVDIDPNKEWWNGPDEDLGYVVAYIDESGERSNGPKRILLENNICHFGFIKSSERTDESFIDLVKTISGITFTSGDDAKNWLTTNGYWTSYPDLLSNYLLESRYFSGKQVYLIQSNL